jgi:hypothetical protein
MNLNKYTKAELISKFKKLDVKNENINSNLNKNSILSQIKSYFSQIWELILTFKNILVKLTLVSLLIQVFKKYKMFRKIWTVLNSIVLAIFGLSLLENSLMDFFKGIFTEIGFITVNILDYITNTNFFQYLSKIFYNKDEIKAEVVTHARDSVKTEKSIDNLHRRTSAGGEWTPSDKRYYSEKDDSLRKTYKSKIADWINGKSESDVNEIQPEIKSDSNSNYKKYLIISGIVIGGILLWYFSDEAKTAGAGLIDWMNSFRTGERDGSSNSSNSSNKPSSGLFDASNRKSVISSETSSSSSDIQLVDKGKSKIMTSPSLEDLNKEAKDSWGDAPGSPGSSGSSSSTETVKPVESTSTIDKSKFGMHKFIIENISKRWRDFLPDSTKESIELIDARVETLDSSYDYIEDLINQITDIKIKKWRL